MVKQENNQNYAAFSFQPHGENASGIRIGYRNLDRMTEAILAKFEIASTTNAFYAMTRSNASAKVSLN
jgi:hypothetical protein